MKDNRCLNYCIKHCWLLLIIASCQPSFENKDWPDGSYRQRVFGEKLGPYNLKVIKYYRKGETDTANYYLIEKYFDNNNLKSRTHFKKSKKYGLHESWYIDGQKSLEVFYCNDTEYTSYKSWYPDGEILEKFAGVGECER